MTATEDTPYCESWRRYRRWHALSIGMFIAYLPVFAALSGLFPTLVTWGPPLFVLFFVYAGCWIAATNVARRWRCPRCGELFFGSQWEPHLPMVFIRSCRYCSLPKYAAADPDLRPNVRCR